jgi:hypothetical protein
VNPSLTITALAEHVMSLVPERVSAERVARLGTSARTRFESLASRGAENA